MDAAAEDVSPQPRDDDHSLVKRAQAGDTGAMADLLDRHFDYVHHLCRRILYNPDDAEDAGQQSLMHAARKIITFNGKSSFRTWLHRVTTNVCLQAIRDGARRTARVEDFDDDDRFDLQNRVAVSLDVRAAVDALAKPFRDVVVLCFFYDMDHENIAAILGISPVTVRTRLHKAKKRLEPLLAESFGVSVRATGARTEEVG